MSQDEQEADTSLEAVAHIIDKIVERGGHILSDKELQRHVIHNAWEVTQEVACSRLQMCFVPHDEEQNSWLLEDEPPPPTKDIWGRKQIEVLREKPNTLQENKSDPRLSRRRKTRAKAYVPGRLANRRQSLLLHKTRILPLSTSVDEREGQDDAWRHEFVQRYTRRLARAEAIARWEEEEHRREEQRRQQEMQVLKRESEEIENEEGFGHPPDNAIPADEMERLPKMNDSIHFDVKSCKVTPRDATEASGGRVLVSVQDTSKADSHATDTSSLRKDAFVRSELVQPNPLQTMRLQPGVVLECGGRKKAGPRPPLSPGHAVWKVYKGLAKQEIHSGSMELTVDIELESSAGLDEEAKDLLPDSPSSYRQEPPDWRSRLPSRPASAHAILGCRSESSLAASLVSKTPATALNTAFGLLDQGRSGVASSKVQGLLAPPSQKDSLVLPRRSADNRTMGMNSGVNLGALRSQPRNPRQKVALLGGHCAPGGAIVQPPLGATMGHGLLPSSEANLREAAKKGEFYYPTTPVKADKPPRASSASLSRTRSHVLERPKTAKTAWK